MNGGAGQPVSEATRLADEAIEAFEDAVEADNIVEQAAYVGTARLAAGQSALAGAYTFLQKLVGGIAVLLPVTVVAGTWIVDGVGIQRSISAYYYTVMGNVFVGALCALGVFFLSYQHKPLRGYELDNKLSYIASAAAIGVALFPTAEHEPDFGSGEWAVSSLHMASAGTLFVLLAFFSLVLFTKNDEDEGVPMTAAKRTRNVVFRICGWTIVGVIVLVLVGLAVDYPESWRSLFVLETIGVMAFGLSWLVKSGIFGILADREPATET